MKKLFLIISLFYFEFASAQGDLNAYEYWFDSDYGNKVFNPITPGQTVNIQQAIPTSGLENGLHAFRIRFRDVLNVWTVTKSQYFLSIQSDLIAYEFWIDNDYANKISRTVTPTQTLSISENVNVDSYPAGIHSFNLRTKNANGDWSVVKSTYFLRISSSGTSNKITSFRYWFDNNTASLTTISVQSSDSIVNVTSQLNTSVLDTGSHTIHIQFRDTSILWSSLYSLAFHKYPPAPLALTIGQISSSFCRGQSLQVPYNSSGSYNLGNIFTAQLSDSSGSFNNPFNIGSIASESSGIINSFLPLSVPNGNQYRIRVISTSPSLIGSDNGSSITVQNCGIILQVRLYLEGFYSGNGLMNNYGAGGSLFVNGLSNNVNDVDSVFISAMLPNPPYNLIEQQPGILQTDGSVLVQMSSNLIEGNSYYLKVKHRNAIETWSSAPVMMTANTNYDFTTAKSKAYGNNQVDIGDGNFAFYSGDISDPNLGVGHQDGIIESQDYGDMENAVYFTLLGYKTEDITGDGIVESSDYGLMENNVYYTIVTMRP